MRDLDQDARTVARGRIGPDRAAVLEVLEDVEGIQDDAVRGFALEVGNEADAARVKLAARVERALSLGHIGVGARVGCRLGHGVVLKSTSVVAIEQAATHGAPWPACRAPPRGSRRQKASSATVWSL